MKSKFFSASIKGVQLCVVGIILSVLAPVISVSQDSSQDSLSKGSYIVLPALGSTPETSFLFGGVGIYQFKMGNPELDTRTSSVFLSGIYTLKNQLSFTFSTNLILPQEQWILSGMYAYNYFPELYWGVGKDAFNNEDAHLYSRKIHLEQHALSKIGENLFTGPSVIFQSVYDITLENSEGEQIDYGYKNGTIDYSKTGLGWVLSWDTRDNMVTPTKNHVLQLAVNVYPSLLSTLNTYGTVMADARKYFDLSNNGRSVFAFQGIMKTSIGTPVLNDLASLGGQNILRGYYSGRLRDLHGAQLQSEWRQQVFGRFGVVVFGAVGQVWHSYSNMELSKARLAGGAGLRFNLDKQNPANIRLDVAVGKSTSGVYLTIGEAF